MDKRTLNFQADRIEMILAAHKTPARVYGGQLTPRAIQFHLAPAATTKLTRLETLTEEIALALGAASARLTRTGGTLMLEVPRRDASFVSLADLTAQLHQHADLRPILGSPGVAILGLDNAGMPLILRLASPEIAHCLIAGTTGSGKTELARTMLASMTAHQKPHTLQIALFDPKAHSFAPFAHAPHLLFPIVSNAEDTLARMGYLVAEMERRARLAITCPRIVLVVDELADWLQLCGAELENLLTRLTQRGRSAGISVIACTQKPTARAVGSLIKANFPARLVGRVASTDDARVAAGIGGTGAEKLAGRGDFLLVAAGETIRFQAAHISAEAIAAQCAPHTQTAIPSPGLRARVLTQLRRVK